MTISLTLAIVGALLALVYAAVVIIRRPNSRARWAFTAGMVAMAAESLFSAFTLNAEDSIDAVRWHSWRLIAATFLAGPWIIFSLHFSRGAQHRRPLWKKAALFGLSLGLPVFALFYRDDLIVGFRDRFAFQVVPTLGWQALFLHFGIILVSVFVLSNLERTYRAAVGTVRWRIKFTLLGLGLFFVARIYTSSQALILRSFDSNLDVFNAGALLACLILMLRSLARAGTVEMDVYPSPAVLRSSLTIVLVGTYLILVGIASKLSAYFGGQRALGLSAFIVLIALVGLAIALQSAKFKLHIHRFVSRHFQRPFYDYRTAWRAFTDSTATELDQPNLCRAAVRQVADLFQAHSVSVWLVENEGEGLACGASTNLPGVAWAGASPSPTQAAAVIRFFRENLEPIDFESKSQGWAESLKRCHPKTFNEGGNRVAMPLISRDTFLGFLIVGDRVNGDELSFGAQDFDMLRCVGNHVAGSLLTLKLSAKLAQSREFEAFKTMAAFFVHDLKNAVSTLNLMLPNLSAHWDNPEFRQDATRGITKTVSRINMLIGKLSELRHELTINTVPADLNGVIERVLEDWKTAPDVVLEKALQPLQSVPIDTEQIHAVITNLLLNGRDAILEGKARPGSLRVETSATLSSAVITVSDNGCGMSQNFLNHSLFKPFQTTKKNGLGIGMFQSKMIVEAHGGRLTVESAVGRGTTFRVILPFSSATPTVAARGLTLAGQASPNP